MLLSREFFKTMETQSSNNRISTKLGAVSLIKPVHSVNSTFVSGINQFEVLREGATFTRTDQFSKDPEKIHQNSAIWRLPLISRMGERQEDNFGKINSFSTGLILQAPKQHHFVIYAVPELARVGYMLPSPVLWEGDGVRELIVDLYKYTDCEDIILPYSGLLMTLCPSIHASLTFSNQLNEHQKSKVQYSSRYEENYSQSRGGRPSDYRQQPRGNRMQSQEMFGAPPSQARQIEKVFGQGHSRSVFM